MDNDSLAEKNIIPPSEILIIESDDAVRAEYSTALQQEGHTIHTVSSWSEAIPLISKYAIDLILLTYQLPEGEAETVVPQIKEKSSRIRIIVMLNAEDEVSRRMLLQKLPIQGCHEKQEGLAKLFIWVDMVLKNLGKLDMIRKQLGTIKSQIKIIEKNKEGLRYIISSMPETINRLQPLDKFIRGILIQLNGFIEAEHSFLATIDENDQLILLVGTGKFDLDEQGFLDSSYVADQMETIKKIKDSHEAIIGDHAAYIPLKTKDQIIGLFYLEKQESTLKELEIEMLRLFVSQVSITIENSNLFRLATVDGLTGLYVRRYFLQRFQEVLQFSSRYGGQAMSLLICDIDHFKKINDTYGHPEGDKVLGEVTRIIRESIRATDVTGRLGGEEFAVLLIDTPKEKAYALAEIIRKKVEEQTFMLRDKKHVVTISIGIAHFSSYSVDGKYLQDKNISEIAMHDVRKMLTSADKALYASKESGRNRVTVSDPLVPGEK